MFYNKLIHPHVSGFIHEIKGKIYTPISTLEAKYMLTKEPVKFDNRLDFEYKTIKVGEKWGELWDCAWFNFKGKVPNNYPLEDIVLMIDLSGEGCLFSETGTPLRGITNVNSDFDASLGSPGKRIIPINEVGNKREVDIWIEAGCNDLFGKYKSGVLQQAEFAIVNHEIRSLYYDYFILLDLANSLPEKDPQRYSILYALEKVFLSLSNEFMPEEVKNARNLLHKELSRENVKNPLFSLGAIGHAHLDLAWLWPLRETRRKAGRTFSTAIANINNYPNYKIGISQPQQFQWIKEDYPELFEKIKEKVKENRIEPQGAMWVEADTNVSGGEALIRQFLYGKKFFKDEFNKNVNVLWLPDVFGFSAALPQIMKKCGVDYFLTIKLSWSEHNKFPHNTFLWQGLDHSEVLVHMPPEGTYNSFASPKSLKLSQDNFAEKGIVDKALLLFGIGDGGGGPGRDHIERINRITNLQGLPPLEVMTSTEFFDYIDQYKDVVRKVKGEMYLERHQGTLTTQANNKKFNRLMEISLQKFELLTAIGKLKNINFDKARLDNIWKEVLLYQFHDILPGSSIKRVYDESVERYSQLHQEVLEMQARLVNTLNNSDGLSVYNSTSFNRKELIHVQDDWYLVEAKPLGFTNVINKVTDFNLSVSDSVMENAKLKVSFDQEGTILSIFDKINHQEVLKEKSNKLVVYNDFGDAWDMYINYTMSKPTSMKLVSSHAKINGAEAIVENVFTFNTSKLIQKVILKHDSDIVEFDNTLQWNETKKMLRVDFTPDINTDKVNCDIQFGSLTRSTLENNSIEYAQFEISAHKWVDLSENNYGFALLNDCKYGHRAKNGVVSLNLMRSPMHPGENADKGVHHFRYAVYPHKNSCYLSDVVKKGYEFNYPLDILNKSLDYSLIKMDNENIVVETVKVAENTQDIVIRLYESMGSNGMCNLKLNFDAKLACETNMLEETISQIDINNGQLYLEFTPFEIKTILVKLK
ncbi:MAG: alpha-mannosidase [Haloplasmataceae bacterium]|nr:alpha-mannosidase [Haloplasmataceae bacterium]